MSLSAIDIAIITMTIHHFHGPETSLNPKTFAEPPRTLFPAIASEGVEFGFEHLPKGSGIPVHYHTDQNEILFIYRGLNIFKRNFLVCHTFQNYSCFCNT